MTDWDIDTTPSFRRQYKNIGYDRQCVVDIAVMTLKTSKSPAVLGRYKKSSKLYAYRLNKGDRLLYDIDYDIHRVVLYRVCDHKSVYGKD